ncbi:hypothetical protein [Streptomyces halobius]|uniref:Uncharacterized protein n=1 Tax=Streptomyces halobius TaxID=2879846 RepID=A0ABY4MAB8_9ACTN|nr:hypothetical protein [Streptomyces halobius]UQA94353.1 hypothetical protein K9S39_23055 [Streptomyces halobius]
MTEPTRFLTAPVELPLRRDLEPVPVDGCDVCGALAREREAAWLAGDGSKVSDCNVEIRKHPHAKRRRP